VLVTVPFTEPHPASGARGVAVLVALAIIAVTTAIWVLSWKRQSVFISALTVLGAAGGVLGGLAPIGTAIAVGCVVCATAGV
jgi:hypothetical protein